MGTNETIVDRVVARLKAAPLGDLITEEDLHDIVKQAIPKTFFEPRRERRPGYGDYYDDKPPLIFDIIRDLLKESARKAVDDWLTANADLVTDKFKIIMDLGITSYVQYLQDKRFTDMFREALRPMVEKMNEERAKAGHQPLPWGM